MATCLFGNVPAASGRRKENFGNTRGDAKDSFSSVSFLLKTEFLFISLPVAGRVSTAPSGTAAATGIPLARIFQGSPNLYGMAAATNFVASITDPPPTARRKSIFFSLATSTAFIAVSYSGLGSMPPNSVTSNLSRAAFTLS